VVRFREVFGGNITIDSLARAIAAFERTLVSGDSPFDRFNSGDTAAMSSSAIRGLGLFRGKARCTICHAFSQFGGQNYQFFSDQLYHNTGVAANDPSYDLLARKAVAISRVPRPVPAVDKLARSDSAASLGRFLVTGNSLDIGAFKTPSLRDVELTAPYFHDGSARTLNDVVKFYLEGGKANLNRDWELHPISLTEDEQADLIEFLKSLTSSESRRKTLAAKTESGGGPQL
jgi:cytochrome c peroxidase